jgi:hypothetical protein
LAIPGTWSTGPSGAGPLAGFEGILIRTAKDQRVIASVSLLNRSVAVSIEHHWVTPLADGTQEIIALLQF